MSPSAMKPAKLPWVSPYLVVSDVKKAMDFYATAFDLK